MSLRFYLIPLDGLKNEILNFKAIFLLFLGNKKFHN